MREVRQLRSTRSATRCGSVLDDGDRIDARAIPRRARRNPLRRPTRPRRAACPADRATIDCRARRAPRVCVGLWIRLAIVPSSPISTLSVAFSSRRASIDRPAGGAQRGAADDGDRQRRDRRVGGDEAPSSSVSRSGRCRQRRIDDDQRVVEPAARQLARRSSPSARACSARPAAMTPSSSASAS